MRALTSLATLVPLAAMVACGDQRAEEPMEFGRPENTANLVMALPATTSSSEALNHYKQGQRAMDMGRFLGARDHFMRAVTLDTTFALGYLGVANTSNSLDEFKRNLDRAVAHAGHASEAERLMIQIAERGFANDVEGQLSRARQLVDLQPESPRAWLTLASIQSTAGQVAEARASSMRAAELAPSFANPHIQLGNSYLLTEPRDAGKAEEHTRRVVELEPNESQSYDLLGDAYRAQGKLTEARDAYTRAAELAPTDGLPRQQRGHVNSFLGNYDAARADYDSAIALGRANQKAAFAVWRALVSVHEGTPQAAMQEFQAQVRAIDTLGVPEPTGLKIGALSNQALIAIHHSMFSEAEQALSQRRTLMMDEAERVGTDEFRRGQEANIVWFDGLLAARRGDYRTATQKAEEFAKLVEPDANPRKLEPMHELMGHVSLRRGRHAEAARHFEQGNLNNPYVKYHLALAYQGARRTADAKRLFGEVADYRFNNVGVALVRQDAIAKR